MPSRGPVWLTAIHLGYGLLLPLAALLKPLLLIPLLAAPALAEKAEVVVRCQAE